MAFINGHYVPFALVGGGVVDQEYDPTSTNAQSGTAVAEALKSGDTRTVYQKFFDENEMTKRAWVDLSFVGGTHYYTSFLTAVSDINAGTTEHSTTTSTDAVCQIFKNDKITVLRLLANISVTSAVEFTKSVIFDINGFTISVSGSGCFGDSNPSKIVPTNIEVCFYGAQIGSYIISDDVTTIFWAHTYKYLYFYGGKYEATNKSTGAVLINRRASKTCLLDIRNAYFYANECKRAIYINCEEVEQNILLKNSKFEQKSTTANKGSAFVSNSGLTKLIMDAESCSFKAFDGYTGPSEDGSSMAFGGSVYGIIKDCRFEGISNGLQIGGNAHVINCEGYSMGHGGIYVNGAATTTFHGLHCELYIDGGYFERPADYPGVSMPSVSSAAYFANHTVYINGAKFKYNGTVVTPEIIAIKDNGVALSPPVTLEETKVFISNSEISAFRVDGKSTYLTENPSITDDDIDFQTPINNHIYLGEGLPAEIYDAKAIEHWSQITDPDDPKLYRTKGVGIIHKTYDRYSNVE